MKTAVARRLQAQRAMDEAIINRDAMAFVKHGLFLQELARDHLDNGFSNQASQILNAISDRLQKIYGPAEWRSKITNEQAMPIEFIEVSACLFDVNSPMVFKNIGLSPTLDNYLINNKIDFHNFYGTLGNYDIAKLIDFLCDKSMHDELIIALTCRFNEFQELQDLEIHNKQQEGAPTLYLKSPFLNTFLSPIGARKSAFKLPERLDDQLVFLASRIEDLKFFVVTTWVAEGLAAFGLRKTLGYLIENCKIINKLEQHLIDSLGDLTSSEAGRLFGTQVTDIAAHLIPSLMKYSVKEINLSLKEFGLKSCSHHPRKIILAAGQYYASSQYHDAQEAKLLAIISVGVRGLIIKEENKVVAAKIALDEAGIPEQLQFKVNRMRSGRAEILENELGI